MRLVLLACLVAIGLHPLQAFAAYPSGDLYGGNPSATTATVQKMQWSESENFSQTIQIMVNTSQVLRFDRAIVRVAISNPEICDVIMVGQKDVLLNSKKPGIVNLMVWDEENHISTYALHSLLDVARLERVLRSIDPTAQISILPFNSSAAVYGTVETTQKLKQITDAAKAFDGSALVFMKLRDSKQVLLEIRFAEVDRRKTKDFKLDFRVLFGRYMFGNFIGQTAATLAEGTGSGSGESTFAPRGALVGYPLFASPTETVGNLPTSYFSRSIAIENFFKWLEGQNIIKIIARPNMMAKDGEEAEFTVGGEFPIPISSNNAVHIEFKKYGNIMKFTPEILDNEVIRLKVSAEVSELDFSVAVSSGGTAVPGLTKRSESTVAELRDNETFVIGGFMSQRISKVHRKVPKLGDAPIIGKIFNADEYGITDVELIITITPHIVKPMQLQEKKDLYNAQEVKEAIRINVPPFPDAQGDTIQNMITQGEKYRDFDKDVQTKEFIESVKSRFPELPKPATPAKKDNPIKQFFSNSNSGSQSNFSPKNKASKPLPPPAPSSNPAVTNFTFSD